jgi:hypothetical protein
MPRQLNSTSLLAHAQYSDDEFYTKGRNVPTWVLPISGTQINFMGEIFGDDTDLLTILLNTFNAATVLTAAQASLDK